MSQKDYFSILPRIAYPYKGKIVDKKSDIIEFVEATDISVRFALKARVANNSLLFFPYKWEDGDRPDTIAKQYYGHEKYSWLVMLSSDIWDWAYDLPMNDDEFNQYLETKYVGRVIFIQDGETFTEHTITNTDELFLLDAPHHYEDGQGFVIDQLAYTQAVGDNNRRVVSFYDFEFEANEMRRNVTLIDVQLLSQVVHEFEDRVLNYKRQLKQNPIEMSFGASN